MKKRRYRYNRGTGRVEEIGSPGPRPDSPQLVMDIAPYEHPITGEMVTSRRQHKELLKRHGCIEVGNEKEAFFKHGGRTDGDAERSGGSRATLLRVLRGE